MNFSATFEFLSCIVNLLDVGIIGLGNNQELKIINKAALEALNIDKSYNGKDIDKLLTESKVLSIINSNSNGPREKSKIKYGEKELLIQKMQIKKNKGKMGTVIFVKDITEIGKKAIEFDEIKDIKNTFETVLNYAYEGILVIDKYGYVTMINQTYADFFGVKKEEVIGKHCTEFVENTRLHIVAKTGKPEIGHVQKIGNHNLIVMRIPMKKNGQVTGVVGKVMFRDIKEAKALVKRLSTLENQLSFYKEELRKARGAKYSIKNFIGQNESIKEIKRLVVNAAKSNSTVIVLGESGTGKELIAHSIHELSSRKYGPFIKINCAAIPDNLLESELFGYEKGAFTGAKQEGKPGKFELAEKGTIFLDEIGDMSLHMQGKLLRVLQEREVERIGGTKSIPIDIRVIAATNQDLTEKIKKGEFREDLYYRLRVIAVSLPPLRERREDIPLLVNQNIHNYNKEFSKYVNHIDEKAMDMLVNFKWSGNVRELKNVIERAFNIVQGDAIKVEHLPDYITEYHNERGKYQSTDIRPLNAVIENAEKDAIKRVLKITRGNKRKSAELLGIHRSSLYQKIYKYELQDINKST